MKSVEMRPAFVWTCDYCGRDNFTAGVVDPDPQSTDAVSYVFIMLPTQVECRHCEEQFGTYPMGFQEEEEDGE